MVKKKIGTRERQFELLIGASEKKIYNLNNVDSD